MKTNKGTKNKKGFTLVELIVVIAILAVLAVTAIMSVGNVRQAAETSALNADASTVVRALNTYNALASTQKTTVSSNSELKALNLTSPPDLVNLNLSVDISDARYAVLFDGANPWVRYEGTAPSGMWVKARES